MGGSQRPFTTTTTFTTLTLDRAAAQDPSPELEKEPRPTTRPHERIVCYLEPEPFSAYQDSFVTLWALHIIVAVAILACAAEGVQMGMRWYVFFIYIPSLINLLQLLTDAGSIEPRMGITTTATVPASSKAN